MKEIFDTLNLLDVSNNSMLKLFSSEDYLSSYSTINVIFVCPLPKLIVTNLSTRSAVNLQIGAHVVVY